MSGENPDPNPEINPDEIEIFRNDFDDAFFDVHKKIKPYLETTILTPFGINKLGFDLVGNDFDWDRSYTDIIKLSGRRETKSGRASLMYDLRPGGMDIARFAMALDTLKHGEIDLDFLDGRSLPHEMYAAGVVTRTYLSAAQSEKSDEIDHILENKTGQLRKLLRNTKPIEKAIGENPIEHEQSLLEILDAYEPEEIIRIQSHRMAAGLYLHHYRSSEYPLQEAIIRAMRGDLLDELISVSTNETTVHGAPNPVKSMEIDLELADMTDANTEEIIQIFEKKDTRMRLRSERIAPSVIGWAYPAGIVELAMFQAEINPEIFNS